jgi:hypothetical protein
LHADTVESRGTHDVATGSSAPSASPPRSREAGIGAEVHRLRKLLDLTVTEMAPILAAARS